MTIAPSLHHGTVDDILHLLAIIFSELAGRGGAHDHHEMLLGVTEELGAEGAVPGELAGIAGYRRQALAGAHRDTEAKTEARAMRLDIGDVVLDLGAEMVGGHVVHRLRAEDALVLELAAIEQ